MWNLDEMGYVETLFGHQEAVTAVDCLDRERAISAGGRDRSVRLWKVVEESQLLFHGHTSSIDCVAYITETNFVSGGDDGILSLWDTLKKKPSCVVKDAHGPGQWIISVAAEAGEHPLQARTGPGVAQRPARSRTDGKGNGA